MSENTGNGRADVSASAESGRTVISSWQETDAEGMAIRPVTPVQGTPAQQPQQPQQWPGQAGQGGWQQPYQQAPQPQQGWQGGTQPQAGMQAMPYGQVPSQAPYQQGSYGGYVPQEQEIPMQGASVPQFVPRKKSKAPLVLGMLALVAIIVVGVAVLSRPEEPPKGEPDVPGKVVPTDEPKEDDATPKQDPAEDGGVIDDGNGNGNGVTTDEANSPVADDFQWAGATWIKEGHVPERAIRLTDLETVAGGWKGYIRYEPAGAGDELVEEYLGVTVGGDRTSATLTFDWGYVIVRDGASRYDDSAGDSTFLGTWDGEAGAIYATCESGNLEMKRFWDEDGRQYAYGTLMLPDGAMGDVYLTRP